MEHVQRVQVKWLIVQHVQLMEQHVQNVNQDISSHQQRHVHPVRVRPIVQHVHKHPTHVRNVILEVIPVEQDVNYAILSQDV